MAPVLLYQDDFLVKIIADDELIFVKNLFSCEKMTNFARN